MGTLLGAALRFLHQNTPATPPAGESRLYFKGDGLPYCKDPSGTERPLIDIPPSLHLNPTFDQINVGTGRPVEWSNFWMSGGATLTADNTERIAGYSARVDDPGSGANGRLQESSAHAINDHQIINFGFWAKTTLSSATIAVEQVTNTTDSGAQYFSAGATTNQRLVSIDTTWRRYTVSFPVPPGHLFGRFSILPWFISGAGSFWYDESFSSATEIGSSGESLAVDVDHYTSAATHNIPSSTFTKVGGFSRVGTDPAYVSMSASGANGNDTWTFITPGTYHVTAGAYLAANATAGRRIVALYLGSTELYRQDVGQSVTATTALQISKTIEAVAGDVLTLQVWQNSVANLALVGTTPGHMMEIAPIKGVKGEPGSDGADGLPGSKWYNESPATPTPPVTSVFAGDMFLYDNGDVAEYNGSTWNITTNVKGPAGTTFATANEGTTIETDTRRYNFIGDMVNATTGPGANDVSVTIQSVLPSGTVVPWPTSVPPTGWLLCNGATYLNTAQPTLAAILRTEAAWVVDANNFRVPDMRGRFPIGTGTFAALAGSDGLAEASRTTVHTHTTPNHTHTDNFVNAAAGHVGNSNTATGGTADRIGSIAGGGPGGSHTHTLSGGVTSSGASTTGASAATAIPYLSLNYIIKT